MKSFLAGALLVAFVGGLALPALAQDEQETLEQKRDKKLAKEFVKKAPWFTDYDLARAEAKKTGKPIFTYFTRSYAY